MEFYKLKIKTTDGITIDEDLGPPNPKVYPLVKWDENSTNNSITNLFKLHLVNSANLIPDSVEILDNFICWNSTYKKEYDWVLLKVYRFTKFLNGWLITKNLGEKIQREKFVLGEKYIFKPAKLKYKNNKLDYFMFQYLYHSTNHILYEKCDVLNMKGEIIKFGFSSLDVLWDYARELRTKKEKNEIISYCIDKYSDIIHIKPEVSILISKRLMNIFISDSVEIFEYDKIERFKLRFNNI